MNCRNNRSTARHLCPSSAQILFIWSWVADYEFLDRPTGLKGGRQPARLFSSSRPGLGWFIRISVFWKYPGIFTPLASRALRGLVVCRLRLTHLFFTPELS